MGINMEIDKIVILLSRVTRFYLHHLRKHIQKKPSNINTIVVTDDKNNIENLRMGKASLQENMLK